MDELFKVKVRKVGTSLGVLIPNQLIIAKKIKVGEEIEMTILKRRKDLISKAFGIAKGSRSFERDRLDRL
jgi:antitoxin component of MazEF toxin-antitoxin module